MKKIFGIDAAYLASLCFLVGFIGIAVLINHSNYVKGIALEECKEQYGEMAYITQEGLDFICHPNYVKQPKTYTANEIERQGYYIPN